MHNEQEKNVLKILFQSVKGRGWQHIYLRLVMKMNDTHSNPMLNLDTRHMNKHHNVNI